MEYQDAERIALEVMVANGCHTVILYGSWPRGQATADSDVDVLCVREEGKAFRDARVAAEGVYIDAFIYPRADVASPDLPLMRVLGGVVLREVDGLGTGLLTQLQALYARGPAPMPDDQRRAVVLWASKMLARIRGQRDLDANYRRMQLSMQCIEDYFALRGKWFEGPKHAFAWLRQHDAGAYRRFVHAALAGASDDAFVELVQAVYGPYVEPATQGAGFTTR
ncbi:MAG: hypothetical protein RL685_688 [Pseudomonadota bacterium]|jgi:predicted nucleotidyltransferase